MTQAWTSFGHAMWRCEVAGLSLLFDPVCSPTHHHGVYSIHPERRFDLDALDDGVLVISHRHADHFDPATLADLARRRPDRLVLTPDALIADAAGRLGFRWTRVLPAGVPLDLGGATLLPTPSRVTFPEWGLLVDSRDALVWNQIDTALDPAPALPARAATWAAALGRPRWDLDLWIARWSPINPVAAQLGDALTFPARGWAATLDRFAALPPRALIPGAGNTRFAKPDHWQNHTAYPLTERRCLADVAARLPGVATSPLVVGRRFELPGFSWSDPAGPVEVVDPHDPRRWRPTHVPPVHGTVGGDALAALDDWLVTCLEPGLTRSWRSWRSTRAVTLRLDLVTTDGVHRRGFEVDANGARPRPADDDWDALIEVDAGALGAVVRGEASWGRALLDGQLRSVRRGYDVDASGLRELALPPVFLYCGLSWDEAFERWLERELQRLGAGPR